MMLGSSIVLPGNVPMRKSVSAVAIYGGGIALFFILASWVLVSENIRTLEVVSISRNETRKSVHIEESVENKQHNLASENPFPKSGEKQRSELVRASSSVDSNAANPVIQSDSLNAIRSSGADSVFNLSDASNGPRTLGNYSRSKDEANSVSSPSNDLIFEKIDQSQQTEANVSVSANSSQKTEIPKLISSGSQNDSRALTLNSSQGSLGSLVAAVSPLSSHPLERDSDNGDCDLYKGQWFYDQGGPLYTNSSCPIITQMQNCQGNGRPDRDYENWRWEPANCILPRFDVRKFFELMRGKTLAFIGDSVARNQFESMLCILWQVEVPKNQGNRRMQRWYFSSASVSVVRIWSSWLVHHNAEAFHWAPGGVDKLFLDSPDENFMEFIPRFDVVVLSSGHWFAKKSVYILDKVIVGGQLWWPEKTHKMRVNNVEAFGISVETILSALVTHPNYTGLTIVRSFSPDHYEGGLWNTGGSCTGKVRPAAPEELVRNEFTEVMHAKQVTGFERAMKKASNKSKLRLMDITKIFSFRYDGHPGPYRNPDPNKKTKRGPKGEPPPQDCLHWCMPGPVDTWNEIVLEIIQREFKRVV